MIKSAKCFVCFCCTIYTKRKFSQLKQKMGAKHPKRLVYIYIYIWKLNWYTFVWETMETSKQGNLYLGNQEISICLTSKPLSGTRKPLSGQLGNLYLETWKPLSGQLVNLYLDNQETTILKTRKPHLETRKHSSRETSILESQENLFLVSLIWEIRNLRDCYYIKCTQDQFCLQNIQSAAKDVLQAQFEVT